MVLETIGQPLRALEILEPTAGDSDILVRIRACGVCRTDLHLVDGDLSEPRLPIVPGHQIVGRVEAIGAGVDRFAVGDRVGVPWLGGSCGACHYCTSDRENLCDHARYTGYEINGGFAQRCVADARYCFPLPSHLSDLQAAPLLCAGLIGYRALRLTEDAARIGFFGFGASAHILIQVARHQNRDVYAFTRPGDTATQRFAEEMGAVWAGGSDDPPPTALDAAILFAPVGDLVPTALRAVAKGGIVVCAGIHMSDIPAFPYAILWGERVLRSVANLTRRDGEAFLATAAQIPIRTQVTSYPLPEANRALEDLRGGRLVGAAVIDMGEE